MIWWMGQTVNYMLRFKENVEERLDTVQFNHPVVGVHIRRTDKLRNDAKEIDLDKYMNEVKEYFDIYEMKHNVKLKEKSVFVAADEPKIVKELQYKYPEYVFIDNMNSTLNAGIKIRYSSQLGLWSIIQDVYLLSKTDFAICTLSSNVCRLTLEMMHKYHVDPTLKLVTLDKEWFWFPWDFPVFEAILDHKGEMKF